MSELNKHYRQNLANSTKFLNDAIGVDLNKETTQDSLMTKYFEMDKERNQLTEISINAAVKAERLRIAKLVMQQDYTDHDDLIHKILYP